MEPRKQSSKLAKPKLAPKNRTAQRHFNLNLICDRAKMSSRSRCLCIEWMFNESRLSQNRFRLLRCYSLLGGCRCYRHVFIFSMGEEHRWCWVLRKRMQSRADEAKLCHCPSLGASDFSQRWRSAWIMLRERSEKRREWRWRSTTIEKTSCKRKMCRVQSPRRD